MGETIDSTVVKHLPVVEPGDLCEPVEIAEVTKKDAAHHSLYFVAGRCEIDGEEMLMMKQDSEMRSGKRHGVIKCEPPGWYRRDITSYRVVEDLGSHK